MTSKTMKTILFASLIAVLTISLVQINDAEANLNGSWTHNNVKIKCFVTGLTATSNVSACNDLTSISNSALEHGALTLTTTTSSYDIATYAWNPCSCGVGRAVTNYNNGDIQYAYSVLKKALSWEDSTVATNKCITVFSEQPRQAPSPLAKAR